jgi:hypothetical protein
MAKIRIYQLAKELGMKGEELLELLDQMGVPYKSHASTLSEEDAEAVRELVKEQRGLQEKRAEEERRKSLPRRPPRGGHHGPRGPREDHPPGLPQKEPHRREGGRGDHPARGGL